MSVIVMGMEMPVSETKYRVVEDMEGRKFLVEDDRLFERCFHLQPLPEKHGRLCDLDEIMNKLIKDKRDVFTKQYVLLMLSHYGAETIVEPEGD